MDLEYNVTYRKKDKGIQAVISYKVDGKWKQKSKQGFKSQKQAKPVVTKIVKELEKKLEEQAELIPDAEGMTFKEFSKTFMAHAKIYKEGNTLIKYNTAINRFSLLDDIELLKIQNIDIQNCVDILVKDKLKVSTLKTYLGSLHFMFNYAKKKHLILENPVIDIELPEEKTKNEKHALTRFELDDLLSKIKNEKYKIISMLAGKCGLRIGEICGLYRSDIDEKNRAIRVDHQWKRLKTGKYGLGDVKRKNSIRIVPVPDSIFNELVAYKNKTPIYMSGRLFPNTEASTLSKNLKRTYKKIGYDISVHELRHTYATLLIGNGTDFKTAASFLGHDAVQTIKTYSHVTSDMIKKATDIINENF